MGRVSKSTVLNKLTARKVETARLSPGKTEDFLHDGGNLVLRLRQTSTGVSKAWQFPFRFNGQRDKIHIGEYPAITLASARKSAGDYRTTLANGQNPKAEKDHDAAVEHANKLATVHGAAPITFGELFERWHRDYLNKHRKDGGEYLKRLFERDILPDGVSEVHLSLMRPAHIKAVLDKIHNRGVKRTCGVALEAIRQMMKWATPLEWIHFDPTLGLKTEDWDGQGLEGDRALSEAEIVQLHWRLKKSSLIARWKHTILLMLATGTRIGETMRAERSRVNMAKSTWSIPPEHQKKTNSPVPPKTHVVHLSAFAKKHMQALLDMPGTTEFVFPARRRKGDNPGLGHADDKTLAKVLNNLQGGEQKGRRNSEELLLQGGKWTPHDLRRTMSTMMQELGINPDVIDKCQHHVLNDKIRRTYQRASMSRFMAQAWDALGGKLEELIQLPDPEPEYVAPKPKYNFLDLTDLEAVTARQNEIETPRPRSAQKVSAKKINDVKRGIGRLAKETTAKANTDYRDGDQI